jgi:hypothetical protein
MRIVHCIWSFTTGGAETMLIDIAKQQAKPEDRTYELHILDIGKPDAFRDCVARFSV